MSSHFLSTLWPGPWLNWQPLPRSQSEQPAMVLHGFQCVCVWCDRYRALVLEEILKCQNWLLECPGSDPSPTSQQADGIQVVRLRVNGAEVEGVVGTMKWQVTSLLLLSNPFRTGVEGCVKWFLFGRLNCLFSEPAESRRPAAPQTRLRGGGCGCHFSLCGSSYLKKISAHHSSIILDAVASAPHPHRDADVSFIPRPTADVKMSLCPGKCFMFGTRILARKLSLSGHFFLAGATLERSNQE